MYLTHNNEMARRYNYTIEHDESEDVERVARRVRLAMLAESAPAVMSPADGVLLLRRCGINVFHELLDAVALRSLDGSNPERTYRQLKGIPEPQQAAPEPQATTLSTAPVVVLVEAWKEKAQDRAREIIKRQREKDLYPDQLAIADEIAKEFRCAGVMGADGKPLTGSYIKRHALSGISSAKGRQHSTAIRRGK